MLAELAAPLQQPAGASLASATTAASAAAATPGKDAGSAGEPDASARPPSCPITRGAFWTLHPIPYTWFQHALFKGVCQQFTAHVYQVMECWAAAKACGDLAVAPGLAAPLRYPDRPRPRRRRDAGGDGRGGLAAAVAVRGAGLWRRRPHRRCAAQHRPAPPGCAARACPALVS